MPDFAIRVEHLSKKYRIRDARVGHQYVALRDVLAQQLRQAASSSRNLLRLSSPEPIVQRSVDFWALKDVTFEVKSGEVLGIIGRNGAGKSTLLKVLSRITEPTAGKVRIRGRLASLLEVGTGFHPELTGRENIFLNGAVLGMTRNEISQKFDAIVAFADVEQFLETPVKRYSSGMYVRLAFAVAAHLDPEILVIDEVLAVGDVEFQKKCMGKIGEVAKGGRTILFVSHNMAAVQGLCSSALLLDGGRVVEAGSVAPVVTEYLHRNRSSTAISKRISDTVVIDHLSASPAVVESGEAVTIRLQISPEKPIRFEELAIFIYSATGIRLAAFDLREDLHPSHGVATATVTVDNLPLVEGDYDLGIWIRSNLVTGDFLNIGRMTVGANARPAAIAPYPVQYRGYLELPYTTRFETTRHPREALPVIPAF